MEQIGFDKIKLGGFWQEKQKLMNEVAIPNVYKRFKETGRFDAFKFEWKEDDEPQPHIFWDSDVAKWIESAAYALNEYKNSENEKIIDETVDLIEKNQGEDGYFNIFFTVCEPDGRFENRMCHELYCAGHLCEAAVAYYNATGKIKFLKCMEKYIAYIKKVFMEEDSAAFSTPGHEEIELALVKMWKTTGNKDYLDLAEYFINTRGNSKKDDESPFYIDQAYSQSHKPVREQFEAVGHSVRACYLYSGMADIANIENDEKLKAACRSLFYDIAEKKMYITGGVGSALVGEAFSESYDLPNELAYSETCAAISLAMFSLRMSLIEANSDYDDVAERAIYNGILSGNSLDGKAFFYENPLEINKKEREMTIKHRNTKQHLPITERVEVFDCSCCPPNFTRFVASIGDYIYSKSENVVYVHQYMKSLAEFDGITITQETDYPLSGRINIKVKGANGKKIALRIPGWCKKYDIQADKRSAYDTTENGFFIVSINDDETTISADFIMEPTLIEANPLVENNFGRAALQYGPIIYCLEGVDNKTPLRSLAINKNFKAEVKYDKLFGVNTIEADGFIYERFSGLYRPYRADKKLIKLKFIPYFSFANRGESDMLVWVRVDE